MATKKTAKKEEPQKKRQQKKFTPVEPAVKPQARKNISVIPVR